MWRFGIPIILIACSVTPALSEQRPVPIGKQEVLSVLGPFVEEASSHARAEDRANADAPIILSVARIIAAVQQSIGVSLEAGEVNAAIHSPYTDGFSADVINCAPSGGPCRISSGAVVVQMRGVYRWQGNLVVSAAYFWPASSASGQERVGLVQAEFWFRRDGGRWNPVRFIELARDSMPGPSGLSAPSQRHLGDTLVFTDSAAIAAIAIQAVRDSMPGREWLLARRRHDAAQERTPSISVVGHLRRLGLIVDTCPLEPASVNCADARPQITLGRMVPEAGGGISIRVVVFRGDFTRANGPEIIILRCELAPFGGHVWRVTSLRAVGGT